MSRRCRCALDTGDFAPVDNLAGNWSRWRKDYSLAAGLHRFIVQAIDARRKPGPAAGLPQGPSAGRRRARSRHGLDHQLDAARAALPRRRHGPQHRRAPVRSAVADGAAMADGRVPGGRCRDAGAGAGARHHRHAVALPSGRAAGQHAERSRRRAYDPRACRWRRWSSAAACGPAGANDTEHADVCGRGRAAIPAHGGAPGAEQELPRRADRQIRAAAAAAAPPPRQPTRRRDASCRPWRDARRMRGSSPPPCGRPAASRQLVQDATLAIAAADRPKVQTAATAWLAWYDALFAEPASPADDAWDAVAPGICRDRVGKLLRSAAGPDQSRCDRVRRRPPRLEQLRLRLRSQHVQQCRPHLLVRHRDHDSGAGDVPRRTGGAVLGDRGLPPCLRTPAGRLRPTSRT